MEERVKEAIETAYEAKGYYVVEDNELAIYMQKNKNRYFFVTKEENVVCASCTYQDGTSVTIEKVVEDQNKIMNFIDNSFGFIDTIKIEGDKLWIANKN